MIQLLWIRRMADSDSDVTRILDRVEESLVARQAELEQQRTAVQRMRAQGSRMGLLPDLVTDRLAELPEGALNAVIESSGLAQADADLFDAWDKLHPASAAL